MKAAVYASYGPPEVVQITEMEKPVPKDNEVSIKVRAASVNPLDWHLMRGMPYEQAAAAPLAAFTALQGLRDKGHIQSGQKVLILVASQGLDRIDPGGPRRRNCRRHPRDENDHNGG
jgi:NADPH:quinone reductase-like Zn-dependent oxidoreductase